MIVRLLRLFDNLQCDSAWAHIVLALFQVGVDLLRVLSEIPIELRTRGHLGRVRRSARPTVSSRRALPCCLCRRECDQTYPSQRPEGANWDVRPSVVAVPTAMCPLTGSSQYHAPPDWIQPVSIIPLPSSQYQLPPSWTQPPERIAPLPDRRNHPVPSFTHPVRIWALPGAM